MEKIKYKKISIALTPKVLKQLESGRYNKSKLIDNLLSEYFKEKRKNN